MSPSPVAKRLRTRPYRERSHDSRIVLYQAVNSASESLFFRLAQTIQILETTSKSKTNPVSHSITNHSHMRFVTPGHPSTIKCHINHRLPVNLPICRQNQRTHFCKRNIHSVTQKLTGAVILSCTQENAVLKKAASHNFKKP